MWWDAYSEDVSGLAPLLDGGTFDARPLGEWASARMRAVGLSRSAVIRASKLNPTFGYQILEGQRRPSRDKIIQLAFGMGLDAAGACELLERGDAAALRSYVRRDVVIAYCLERGLDLSACDDLLWGAGEKTILPYGGGAHAAESVVTGVRSGKRAKEALDIVIQMFYS